MGQDDDGFILYESRAISRYIASKAPASNLLPPPSASIQERALFEQAVFVETSNFHPPVLALLKALYHDPPLVEQAAEARAALVQSLDGYERILGKQRCVAGEGVTVVDLWHLLLGA